MNRMWRWLRDPIPARPDLLPRIDREMKTLHARVDETQRRLADLEQRMGGDHR